jgi:hypothetical protein
MKIAILLIFIFSISILPQSFLKGIGVEVGLGYNQMHYELLESPTFIINPNSKRIIYREAFKMTPTLRLSYKLSIFQKVGIIPFFEYSILGGKSEKFANGIEDEYKFQTLSIGQFASYFLDNYEFSIGLKYNHFQKVIWKYYGLTLNPPYEEVDQSVLFKNYSFDFGMRISYKLNEFIFSTEGWFSLTNLFIEDYFPDEKIDVNTRRFIVLVGYRL